MRGGCELRYDPKVRACAHRCPEEVRILGLGRGADESVSRYNLDARDLVCEKAPETRGDAEATLTRVTADADVGTGTVGESTFAWVGEQVSRTGQRPEGRWKASMR